MALSRIPKPSSLYHPFPIYDVAGALTAICRSPQLATGATPLKRVKPLHRPLRTQSIDLPRPSLAGRSRRSLGRRLETLPFWFKPLWSGARHSHHSGSSSSDIEHPVVCSYSRCASSELSREPIFASLQWLSGVVSTVGWVATQRTLAMDESGDQLLRSGSLSTLRR